jgi:NarL family two-component system sensor histidine kinase LiaS
VELQQKVPMKIQWKIEPIPLNKGVEDHLFRILQESVSNTLRHAKATTLEVLLIKRDNLVILRVVDDGIGFNVEETKTGSYGLQNMHERAVEIGGTLQIVSVPNQGTRLEVRVPMLSLEGEADD